MLKHTFRALFILCACLAACQSKKEETHKQEPPAQTTPLSFRTETVSRKSELCGTNQDGCATATVSYLIAQNGEPALRDSINAFVRNYLLQLQLGQNPDAQLKATNQPATTLAEAFIEDQEDFVASQDEIYPTSAWYLEVSATPILESEAVTTLQLESSTYTGGAHGASYVTLHSFDKNGRALHITDLVTDTVQLIALAEEDLLKQEHFEGATSVKEAGLFIDGGTLPLPQQAALTPNGLLLLYNSYEIGPYALGRIRIEIPYHTLGKILNPKYKPD